MSKITKLGLGIVAFDDICHLRNIIEEIREQCDEVVVCLQKESYHGDPIDDANVRHIEKLRDMKLVDDIIWFESTTAYPDDAKKPRLIETDKRNFIIDFLEKERGCSHVLITDSDEFYDSEDFARAKAAINDSPTSKVTYCQYINYYRDYEHVMLWPFDCYVPFITESSYRFQFETGGFPKPSDPTRRYKIHDDDKYMVLGFNTVKMHHLSWIRTDISDKIKSWSAKKYFDMDVLGKRILDRYENFLDGDNAIIMFNAPGNEVVVNSLGCRYINPKHNLNEPLPE